MNYNGLNDIQRNTIMLIDWAIEKGIIGKDDIINAGIVNTIYNNYHDELNAIGIEFNKAVQTITLTNLKKHNYLSCDITMNGKTVVRNYKRI